jgi:prepilin-type N-terminal cleavage/methylation domain-containing protein
MRWDRGFTLIELLVVVVIILRVQGKERRKFA